MKAIFCVNNDWAIGKNGDLLYRISDDLRNFKELTTGGAIIYGLNTLATFPKASALPKRDNFVLTHNPSKVPAGITPITSDDIPKLIKMHGDKLWLIGDASVYKQFIDYCDGAVVTFVDDSVEDADAFFPDLSKKPGWTKPHNIRWRWEGDKYRYRYEHWTNSNPIK
jgi:dihydrofolate reductase